MGCRPAPSLLALGGQMEEQPDSLTLLAVPVGCAPPPRVAHGVSGLSACVSLLGCCQARVVPCELVVLGRCFGTRVVRLQIVFGGVWVALL